MFRASAVLLLFASVPVFAQQGTTCEYLAQLSLDHVKIVSAQTVAAGQLPAPSDAPPQAASFFKSLPAFCRVQATAMPSADSAIGIEVWMPAAEWNGRFRGVGNGGFAGDISVSALARAVRQGYAAAATNTGHSAGPVDASWALGHPEKIKDFGYRGIHEMTRVGQALTREFYGKPAMHSYFSACSDGGREALMEAQRFPDDYDGIIAGAPANKWSSLLTTAIWDAQAITETPGSFIPPAKLPAITAAVNKSCNAKDGVTDGVINDPPSCKFDPAVLLCKGGDSDQCLTGPQLVALKKLYQGSVDSHGQEIFPGLIPGSEAGDGGWVPWVTGAAPGKALIFAFGIGYFSNMVYDDKNWDYRGKSMDTLLAAANAKTASDLNATDPDLSAFQKRGGKLILYHGWDDPAISPLNSINYYRSVEARMGRTTVDRFVRLFMVPGMKHCADGDGATDIGQFDPSPVQDPRHDISLSLENWVEKAIAPEELIAVKPGDGTLLSRPLCRYPQVARYTGKGDTNTAENFVCSAVAK